MTVNTTQYYIMVSNTAQYYRFNTTQYYIMVSNTTQYYKFNTTQYYIGKFNTTLGAFSTSQYR